MTEARVTGQCVCGAVGISVAKLAHSVGACHCATCRRWGGGPLMAVDCGDDVRIEGEAEVTLYDSSDWAQRGFCRRCGTHLFYLLREPRQFIMSAGLFGDDPDFVFDHQVFIDEKPPWYDFANQTENMTGAEVFAKYAPPEGKA